jgi:hypothetical protein
MLRRVTRVSGTVSGSNISAVCFLRGRSLHISRPQQHEEDGFPRHHAYKEVETAEISDAEWELRVGAVTTTFAGKSVSFLTDIV